jgi:predicted 2-oxoglutarate/Fe(II)-dependent dioxygenase YbiX
MNVTEYIKYYKNVIPNDVCEDIMNFNLNFQPSTYSNHKGKTDNSDERVRMDECWIRNDNSLYGDIKAAFENVCNKYSKEFSLFSVQRMTDFRINRYSKGGFMSSHVDNIHHSHGQQYGYPQVSVLLYLNDDYKGGNFYVANKKFEPEKGSGIIFPSNFMFPHEAQVVTKGTRWSIISWLM